MNSTDTKILLTLQKEGRLTNQELAERINLSPSPCLRRVKNLEEAGIIKGYTAIVDEKAVGLPLTAFVRIKLEKHTQEMVNAFEAAIKDIDSIIDCYVMSGNTDYLLRILSDSLESYEVFVRYCLRNVEGIASIETNFAYGVIKRSTTYPLNGSLGAK